MRVRVSAVTSDRSSDSVRKAVGVEAGLSAEALDPAHGQAGLKSVAGVDLDEGVGEEAAAEAVAFAEVGRELQAVRVHDAPAECCGSLRSTTSKPATASAIQAAA
jgi:hypothetical protein